MSSFCHNCGYQARPNSVFCGSCGTKLIYVLNEEQDLFRTGERSGSEFLDDLKGIVAEFVDDLNSPDELMVKQFSNQSESVIDVTGAYETIPKAPQEATTELTRFGNVPQWPHFYVYSASDLQYGDKSQKRFYNVFRNSFLRGEYLDIEGNTNYAFVLLFDLLGDFQSHQDLLLLERQFERLKLICPKTESYSREFLVGMMESAGDLDGANRINTDYYREKDEYFENDYWTLAKKYKNELNPTKDDEVILGYVSDPNNVFCDIEFCFLEVLKLYIKLVTSLDQSYKSDGNSFGVVLELVADSIVCEHYKCRRNTGNYTYTFNSVKREFFTWLFKNCENTVRDYFRHTRKLRIEPFYPYLPTQHERLDDIQNRAIKILPSLISTLPAPDEATEKLLNELTTTRWKYDFNLIKDSFKTDGVEGFVTKIEKLGELNTLNPSAENIYFEASKFLAKKDRQASVRLYLKYLYVDLHSEAVNNKQLSKTIQKSLFSTNEQLHEFQRIISRLYVERNLDKALSAVPGIYAIKRKKIKLDPRGIEKVQLEHSDTVDFLEDYLNDEFEDADTAITTIQNDREEIEILIAPKESHSEQIDVESSLSINQIHSELLDLFFKSNFEVTQNDLNTFAESKGMFKNQLVDEINDAYFELVDDVLIEEEEDVFVIYEPYFHQITNEFKN